MYSKYIVYDMLSTRSDSEYAEIDSMIYCRRTGRAGRGPCLPFPRARMEPAGRSWYTLTAVRWFTLIRHLRYYELITDLIWLVGFTGRSQKRVLRILFRSAAARGFGPPPPNIQLPR